MLSKPKKPTLLIEQSDILIECLSRMLSATLRDFLSL